MKDERTHILKMLEYAQKAVEYVGGIEKADFFANDEKMSACSFAILQVQEHAGRLSEEAKQEFSEIPWTQIRAMRNIIVHNYERLNANILWDTLVKSLPNLIEVLKKQSK